MITRRCCAAIAVCAGLAASAPARADVTTAGDLHLATVGTFNSPVFVTAPPGDTSRLFVVEQGGTVQLIKDGGAPTTFLDIHSLVSSASGDGGLLSIAFPPDYAASGKFYAFYTDGAAGSCSGTSCDDRVVEFQRSADPDVADPPPGRLVLVIPHRDSPMHHGGQLQFGPDGLLYVSTGDGDSSGDPLNHAQDTTVLNGKLLRIDPRQSGTEPYTIPVDNPFAAAGDPGADEIYSYGLRNPFRFSFDHLTGDLAIGDVGEHTKEEVDWVAAAQGDGANFGWNVCEADLAYPSGAPCPANTVPHYVAPAFSYGRGSGICGPDGAAVIGGYVVRDSSVSLAGKYVYGDFCRSLLRAATLPAAADDADTGLSVTGITSFGEDAYCRIYVTGDSIVYRLESTAPPAKPPGCPGAAGGSPGPGAAGGSPGAGAAAPDLTPPRILSPRMARKRFAVAATPTVITARVRRGTAFRYTLSERARMRIAIERLLPGRRVAARCLRSVPRLRSRPVCGRHVAQGSLQRAPTSGSRTVAFSGRIGHRSLAAGHYRAVLRATDDAGNVSSRRLLFFTVLAG